MKKNIYSILSLTAILILNACSSVKVLDSWKADNVNSINDKNILVIARTADDQARIAFENEIVKQLTATGKKATASFTKFPKINHDEKVTDQRQEMILSIIKSEGLNAVVLTVIKDYQEQTETVTEGGYYAGGSYDRYYPRYYGGFNGYYRNPYSYSTYGTNAPSTTTTYNTKTYVLETVAYNLDEPAGKQLVTVVTSKIEDPSNVTSAAKDYVKAIIKSLK